MGCSTSFEFRRLPPLEPPVVPRPSSSSPKRRLFKDSKKYSRSSMGGTIYMSTSDLNFNLVVNRGLHKLRDLCIFPDISSRPPCVEVFPVEWQQSGPHSSLLLPKDFDCKIPSVQGSPLLLSFYGCSCAEGSDTMIRLRSDAQITDFLYTNYKTGWVLKPEYGAGGLGIEYHDFIHLETPMESDSGVLLLGKLKEHEYEDALVLQLTAFEIPMFMTVLIPPRVLHSNDHFEGLWRTMLPTFSDADIKRGVCDIDHAIFKQQDIEGKLANVDLQMVQQIHSSIPRLGAAKVSGAREYPSAVSSEAALRASERDLMQVPSDKEFNPDEYRQKLTRLGHSVRVSAAGPTARTSSASSSVRFKSGWFSSGQTPDAAGDAFSDVAAAVREQSSVLSDLEAKRALDSEPAETLLTQWRSVDSSQCSLVGMRGEADAKAITTVDDGSCFRLDAPPLGPPGSDLSTQLMGGSSCKKWMAL
mmetsp:Transcript_129613/g.323063  ORF Transcript_129613/g.323063 Transcript_129613/m.323063 type:complete len:472 (-) Transcript_129613:32-1447(-)